MNLIQIANKFDSELKAVRYFERYRWKNGKPVCPYCSSVNKGIRNRDLRWHCKGCNKTYSVTTGTKLHNTRLPLKTWLYAFAIVTDAKKGLSAKQLERNLGIEYRTAWKIYHQIRDLMAIDNKTMDKLDGVLEMDETFIGGKPRKHGGGYCLSPEEKQRLDTRIKQLKSEGHKILKGSRKVACATDVKRGRGTKNIPVVGIIERSGDVVAQVMRKLSYQDLKKMVAKYATEEKSVMITDQYKGYSRFKNIIEHIKIDHKKYYSYKGLNTNTIESFWAIIERGIMGQYHQVSPKYLPKYIAEFVFKYNNRKVDDMFETLVRNSMLKK